MSASFAGVKINNLLYLQKVKVRVEDAPAISYSAVTIDDFLTQLLPQLLRAYRSVN
jgi:hypothetical protein